MNLADLLTGDELELILKALRYYKHARSMNTDEKALYAEAERKLRLRLEVQ